MKKAEFKEELGVPEGIVDAGRQLFDDIKKNLFSELNPNQTEYELRFSPDESYTFGDKTVDDVQVNITLHPVGEYGDSNMGIRSRQRLEDTGKSVINMSVNPDGFVMLSIDKPVPQDWNVEDVKKSFDRYKVQNVTSLSHELMHDYDNFKRKISSPSHATDYQAKTHFMNFPVRAIGRLFFDLYYLDKVENTVRPTELYAKAKENNITKSEFLDFFKKEYDNILDAMKFNADDLVKELLNNIDEVDDMLRQVDDLDQDVDQMTDKEKVENLLRIAYVSFSNLRGENLRELLLTNPLEIIFGLQGSKEKYFDKHLNKILKHQNNPFGFYQDAEKYLKNTGRRVIKKMGKVYGLLPD